MIEVIIQAGFGNQLFQYAMGYALSKQLNRPLSLDISFFDYCKKKGGFTSRVNNLDKLALDNCNIKNAPSSYYKYIYGARLSKTPFWKIFGFKNHVLWEDFTNCRNFQKELIDKATLYNNVTLYGFWQNTDYFKDFIHDLKRQFIPNYTLATEVQEIKNIIQHTPNSVGIHIRRGDFIGLGWAEGADYYNRAIRRMTSEIGSTRFFIVTDDKQWVRENFSDNPNIYIIDLKTETCDIDEFFLLSICNHQIISESTFGWWAAFLNTNPNRIIIIPNTAKGEMFPNKWIRI